MSLMLLGVISDTHGRLELTERAVQVMQKQGVEQVIHCGDVGGAAVVQLFHSLTTHFVAGNCDSGLTLQMAVEAAGHRFHGRLGELELLGRRIAFLHGDSHLAMKRLLDEGNWDLIAYGHTHVAKCQRDGQTLVLNPGAFVRCEQPSVATVQLPELRVTSLTLDWS